MRVKLAGMALIAALIAAFVVAPLSAAAKPAASDATFNVTGTLTDGGSFTGTLTDLVFSSQGGNLVVEGVLNGTLTLVDGTVVPVTDLVFETVVNLTQTSGSCEILHLVIGPINLDLLGLVVDISQITIDITAEPGPGNLLGNLLCGIAGLLDSNVTTNALARLLNQLLGLLG